MNIRFAVMIFGALCAVESSTVLAQQTSTSGASIAPGGPSLKKTLETGLKARRPVEFAFIKKVTTRVDEGTLPKSLVESTFLWARKKRPYSYPFFEAGLKQRAKKLGIAL